jgi:histidinol-phosphate phosphatase family protein
VSGRRAAVFLDRDGTIIEDMNFIASPSQVRLVEDAAHSIARLNAARIPVIVVSNQSGIGRGLISHAEFSAVQERVEHELAKSGARIDAVYICPHSPDESPPCDCRKPGTALFERAASDHDLDLARSWYIGDRWRDVAPSLQLGGSGRLVPAPSTRHDELHRASDAGIVRDSLSEIVDEVLGALTGGEVGR